MAAPWYCHRVCELMLSIMWSVIGVTDADVALAD
jgi:hypothetical protein